MPHQKGPITSTFTVDWFLRQGQGRELLREWMKLTSVRSQDQRRMLQVNSHTFPTNAWIHKITKGKESDRCDLCRALDGGRPVQDGEGPSRTNTGAHPTYLRSLLSITDPWGIVTVSGSRMEVFVCLRREMPPDYMG
jgi:hypothetical protein